MKSHALIVGINQYDNRDEITPLRYAVRDASRVHAFFASCGYEVSSLLDSEATQVAIMKALRRVATALRSGDRFLFYFSGHGYHPPGDERQHLLPRDADLWAIQHGGAGALTARFVSECTRVEGVARAVILDACRTPLDPHKGAGDPVNAYCARDIQCVAADAPRGSPLAVLYSSSEDQPAYERGDLEGGIFTTAMLDVFQELKAGGRAIQLDAEVPRLISDRFGRLFENGPAEMRTQTPHVECPAGGIVLVPGLVGDVAAGLGSKSVTEAAPARLAVRTEPAGADIEIDGIDCGKSPLTAALNPGRHQIKAKLGGHVTVERWIDFDGRAGNELALPLTPLPAAQTANLRILTTPLGADVEVNGKPCGRSPLTVPLAAGRHIVRARMAGFVELQRFVDFDGKRNGELPLYLNPTPFGAPAAGQARPAPLSYERGYDAPKSKVAAALFAFFLGVFGVHNFYLGHVRRGRTQLLITVLLWWIGGVPVYAVWIWSLVEFIQIVTGSARDSQGRPLE